MKTQVLVYGQEEVIRAGDLNVGDVLSYFDMANPYEEWTIIEIVPDQWWGKIAKIKNNKNGRMDTCYSPISFKRDGYAGWKFVKGGKTEK